MSKTKKKIILIKRNSGVAKIRKENYIDEMGPCIETVINNKGKLGRNNSWILIAKGTCGHYDIIITSDIEDSMGTIQSRECSQCRLKSKLD